MCDRLRESNGLSFGTAFFMFNPSHLRTRSVAFLLVLPSGLSPAVYEPRKSKYESKTQMAIRTNGGNTLKYIPTDFGEIAYDTASLNDAETLVYFRFRVHYMMKGSLPAAEEKLLRIAQLREPFTKDDAMEAIAAFKEMDQVVKVEAVDQNTGEVTESLAHEEWDRLLTDTKAKIDSYVERGRKGADKRWGGESDEN